MQNHAYCVLDASEVSVKGRRGPVQMVRVRNRECALSQSIAMTMTMMTVNDGW